MTAGSLETWVCFRLPVSWKQPESPHFSFYTLDSWGRGNDIPKDTGLFAILRVAQQDGPWEPRSDQALGSSQNYYQLLRLRFSVLVWFGFAGESLGLQAIHQRKLQVIKLIS